MNYNDKTNDELLALSRQIEQDPVNRMPAGCLYLYTPKAIRKLDQIARAITNNMAEKRKMAGNPVVADGYSGRQSNRR